MLARVAWKSKPKGYKINAKRCELCRYWGDKGLCKRTPPHDPSSFEGSNRFNWYTKKNNYCSEFKAKSPMKGVA